MSRRHSARGPRPATPRPQVARASKRAAAQEQDAAPQKLHKILAQAGLGSRRAMETWIGEGKVTVNGAVANVGMRVAPGDVIKVGAQVVRWQATRAVPRVLIYHKPEGEIVSRDDPEGRVTVFDRLPPLRGGKWLAIGRLDFNTSGLLMFTDSGELANRLTHPRFEVEREYAVRILGEVTAEQRRKLLAGIKLSDGVARCLSVEAEGGEGSNRWYRIVLDEGRNRVVRRLFEALGLTVSRLMRVRFGAVALPPRLKRGQLAELPRGDVKSLQRWLDESAQAPRLAPRD
jgi:23S rRNA pseudouridine2605 synthase